MSLSGVGIRIMLASSIELGSLPSWILWNSLRRGVSSSQNGKIHLWSYLVQDFCLLGVFLISASFSLGVICLFTYFDSSWFSFGRFYVSRYLSILSRFPICWHIVVHNIFLQSFEFLWCQLLFIPFHFYFIYLVLFSFFLDESG